MIHEIQLEKVHAGVFYHPDLEKLKKAFYKKFTVIQAAGGVVRNEKKEILIIFRRGKWDLPKGKLDENEKPEDGALREVKEETGLQNVQLISPLAVTYHTYHEGTRFILKESHWYTMKAGGNQQLIPQTNEDILELKWVKPNKLQQHIKDSYPSVADVLATGLNGL
jgi:8-oxo-dGTP pyrophosphatase MutT (NUDIX family)